MKSRLRMTNRKPRLDAADRRQGNVTTEVGRCPGHAGENLRCDGRQEDSAGREGSFKFQNGRR